jgi:hypothetical protein
MLKHGERKETLGFKRLKYPSGIFVEVLSKSTKGVRVFGIAAEMQTGDLPDTKHNLCRLRPSTYNRNVT